MKQSGLLVLCFCILISGVRGQEVVTRTLLTGFPNATNPIVVQESQNLEILSYSPRADGDSIVFFLKPIEWQESNRPLDWGVLPSEPDLVTLTGSNIVTPVPLIIGGPAKICFKDFGKGCPATLAYRITSKAGYSPNISPASLASNTNFVSGLTQTILSSSNSYGLATRTELIQALAESRADGINSVISNPNLWTLYTTNQIHAMAIGDLVLTSTNNGQFVLNYDIEQSEDLVNWTPYQGFALPLTNLPTNKAFVRIKAKQ